MMMLRRFIPLALCLLAVRTEHADAMPVAGQPPAAWDAFFSARVKEFSDAVSSRLDGSAMAASLGFSIPEQHDLSFAASRGDYQYYPRATHPAPTMRSTRHHPPTTAATTTEKSHKSGDKCPSGSTLAVPGQPPSVDFCQNPPVVPDLNVSLYGNARWYSIYNSGYARNVSSSRCVTANYSLQSNGTINVLNCQVRGTGKVKPSCVQGFAKARANATKAAQLQVQFPGLPVFPGNPGTYNVVALLGSPKTGYDAAAVYGCGTIVPGVPPIEPGIFILSRTLDNREETLMKLKRKLKCEGFDISVEFEPVDHSDCLYFFEPTGFTVERRP